MTSRLQTPSQTVGPFFSIGLTRELQHVLFTDASDGERIVVEGSVFDGANAPIDDALIEIWQADAQGRYRHPLDTRGAVDSAFAGFGRAATTEQGRFAFETIRPGATTSPDGRWHAPHLNVVVFARGMLAHAFTRMYFSDDDRNVRDPLMMRIAPARRQTLIGERVERGGRVVYVWDIHLQGARETVFLDA